LAKYEEDVGMSLVELFLIPVGLSMDAFAVSICTGLSMQSFSWKKSMTVGLYFGVFQAAMPLIGYLLGSQFADKIISFDHWIAFLLLC
jgi:putative Mn2+ efflux pump MntP